MARTMGAERWTGTDPNICRPVGKLVAQIDRHDENTAHEPSEVHFVKGGLANAASMLVRAPTTYPAYPMGAGLAHIMWSSRRGGGAV